MMARCSFSWQLDERGVGIAAALAGMQGKHTGMILQTNATSVGNAVSLLAVINPLSKATQRLGPLLEFMWATLQVSMQVITSVPV